MEKRSKIIRLITSVIIAIALWVYVINVVNPSSSTTVRNIPVKLTGTEVLASKNLAITGSGEYTVDLSVNAQRTELAVLSPDNFIATADVSGLTLGQDYITVEVTAPNGYVVEDIRSRKIQVYVDELTTKTVSVDVEYSDAGNSYETAVLSMYPSIVEISGSKQLVDSIHSYVVSIDSSKLSYEELSYLSLEGEVRDSSGNVLKGLTVNTKSVDVTATIYSTKTVAFKMNYSGSPWHGAKVRSVSAPGSITVKGPAEVLAGVSEISSQWVDIDGIFDDFETPIRPILPGGVIVCKKDQNAVFAVDIDDTGSVQFEYSADEIVTNNLPEGLTASYTAEGGGVITVTVTGPVAVLRGMSPSDVVISVDGSNFKESTKSAALTAGTPVSGVNLNLSPASVKAAVKKY